MKIEPVRGWVDVVPSQHKPWDHKDRQHLIRVYGLSYKTPVLVISLTPESIDALREKVSAQMRALASPKEILAAIGITEEGEIE